MLAELRCFDWRPAASLIPGLVHFGSDQPTITPQTRVKRLRLSIRGEGQLRIARLTVTPRAPDTLDGAQVVQSSHFSETQDTTRAFAGQSIHSKVERDPFWEATFPAPIAIERIEILNLLGRAPDASYPLTVQAEDEFGRLWLWNNAGELEIRQRLAAFAAKARAMAATFRTLNASAAMIAKVESRVALLIAATEKALADCLAPVDLRLRLRTLRGLVALVNEAGGDMRAALLAADPVMNMLIERRAPARKRAPFAEAEVYAVAMASAAALLRRGKVSRYRTAEDGAFLRAGDTIKQLEAQIDALFLKAGGDPRMSPILYRKHGLAGPHLLLESERHLDGIEEITAAFEARGYPCALAYGTLLGAVREKTFIPHDDDIDLMFVVAGTPESGTPTIRQLLRDLGAAGFQPRLVEAKLIVKVRGPVTGIEMDLFPIFDDGGPEVSMAMQKLMLRAVRREVLLPFAPIEFYGRRFLAPAQPEAWLGDMYGATWQTPIRYSAGGSTVMSQ